MSMEFDFGELDELYQEIVLDHYKNPRGRGEVPDPDVTAEGFNPFCGDQVSLRLKLDGQGRVARASFRGQGCSISQASASMLTALVEGRTLPEVQRAATRFRDLMHGKQLSEAELEELGDLEALQGVRKFPIRIKCALLSWAALEEGIEEYQARAGKR